MPKPGSLAHAPEFRRTVIRWFRRHGRSLPWRANPGSLPHPRLGVHAATDPGQPGGGLLPALSPALPHPALVGCCPGQQRARELGRSGVLSPGSQSASVGPGGGAGARGDHSVRAGGAPKAARSWPLHGGRGGQLCVRAPVGGRRHECGKSASTCVSPEGWRGPPGLANRRADSSSPGEKRVGLQSSDNGTGSFGLYGKRSSLRAMPGAADLRYGKEEPLRSASLRQRAPPVRGCPQSTPRPAAGTEARRNSGRLRRWDPAAPAAPP
jgi:hypothetical protein